MVQGAPRKSSQPRRHQSPQDTGHRHQNTIWGDRAQGTITGTPAGGVGDGAQGAVIRTPAGGQTGHRVLSPGHQRGETGHRALSPGHNLGGGRGTGCCHWDTTGRYGAQGAISSTWRHSATATMQRRQTKQQAGTAKHHERTGGATTAKPGHCEPPGVTARLS